MSDTQLIKDKIDIVDFISEYTQLKPAGINHKGLCPFHHEKSPSFMVSRERQSWHCFGCGKGGDIFSFIQEMEGMEFVEALKHLANRAGVQLTNRADDVNGNQKNRLKDINLEAARFWHNFLQQMNQAKSAREYLNKRGLIALTIEKWQIGFIPDQWDLLTKYLLKKGHSIDDLIAAGLTIKREGADFVSGRGFYDRFRGRIMFPIRDIHGSVVGFTGRVLVETENSGGKYVNTPQTSLYDKSRVIYGLDKAKQEIKRQDLTVLVEGQMDVIACHQMGMENVVAASGTALTEHQVSLLKRYSTNIVMSFDADAAGIAAARRGIEIAIREGLSVKVIEIPDGAGKDPDECIKKNSQVWQEAVNNAQEVMKWYFSRAFNNRDLHHPKQRQEIVNELLPNISLIPYAVEKDFWLKELAGRLGVEMGVLREDLANQNPKSKTPKSKDEKKIEIDKSDRLTLLLEEFLTLIFKFPHLWSNFGFGILDFGFSAGLSTAPVFSLYEAIKREYTNSNSINLLNLRAEKGDIVDILQMKGELDFANFTQKEAEIQLKKIKEEIQNEVTKARRERLQKEIEEAERTGDHEKLKQLMEQF
jgi:DNA primase